MKTFWGWDVPSVRLDFKYPPIESQCENSDHPNYLNCYHLFIFKVIQRDTAPFYMVINGSSPSCGRNNVNEYIFLHHTSGEAHNIDANKLDIN